MHWHEKGSQSPIAFGSMQTAFHMPQLLTAVSGTVQDFQAAIVIEQQFLVSATTSCGAVRSQFIGRQVNGWILRVKLPIELHGRSIRASGIVTQRHEVRANLHKTKRHVLADVGNTGCYRGAARRVQHDRGSGSGRPCCVLLTAGVLDYCLVAVVVDMGIHTVDDHIRVAAEGAHAAVLLAFDF